MELLKTDTFEGEPCDIDALMLDLRIDSADERDTLVRLAKWAADQIETTTGYVILPGTYTATFDLPCWDSWEVLRSPLREINAIEYLSAPNTWTEMNVDDFHVTPRKRSFLLTPLSTFVAPSPIIEYRGYRMTFEAGFDNDADSSLSGQSTPLPPALLGMLTMFTGHLMENRELFDKSNLVERAAMVASFLGSRRQYW